MVSGVGGFLDDTYSLFTAGIGGRPVYVSGGVYLVYTGTLWRFATSPAASAYWHQINSQEFFPWFIDSQHGSFVCSCGVGGDTSDYNGCQCPSGYPTDAAAPGVCSGCTQSNYYHSRSSGTCTACPSGTATDASAGSGPTPDTCGVDGCSAWDFSISTTSL